MQAQCTRAGCGKTSDVYPSRLRRGPVLFCSLDCKYGRRSAAPDRFWEKVDKNGPVIRPDLGPCWIWTGAKDRDGYGMLTRGHRQIPAHRHAYTLTHGPIPDDLWVLHHCDNPPCVRHLFLGTVQDNTADMIQKGRAQHPGNFGTANGSTRLTEEGVRAIRSAYAGGRVSQQRLADEYGVSRRTVGMIVSRETWQHVT